MRKSLLAVAIAGLTLAGCGGGDVPAGGGHTCHPQGDRLSLLARNTAFDTDCLALNAGSRFEIEFDNQDGGVQHSVSVLTQATVANASGRILFEGRLVQGPAIVTYTVPALAAGTYQFRCEVHPDQMNGTLIVE